MRPPRRWALVPAKPFALAKTRLAAVLSPEVRARLAQELLERTLLRLRDVDALDGVAVLSRDAQAARIASEHGALSLPEAGSTQLGALIDSGLSALGERRVEVALVVLSDLPYLASRDIEAMLELGERHSVVIAADTRDEGTNALLLRPPGRMPTCFGRYGSFLAHERRARVLGLDAAPIRRPSLGFDLDTIDDLHHLLAAGGGGLAALTQVDAVSLSQGAVKSHADH
ncbi:MAG: 2-phospho-L-lactate guanylyltransferase [Myxococcales bacterium]|nr:2-phospho-L-lactate guanylyltransferase [Myxococcales bacterium]